jgi:hypothetical protein
MYALKVSGMTGRDELTLVRRPCIRDPTRPPHGQDKLQAFRLIDTEVVRRRPVLTMWGASGISYAGTTDVLSGLIHTS